jgi:hypothetical protein
MAKAEAALKIIKPTTPEIKTSAVKVESAGQTFKTVVVTVGADFQLQ